MVTESPTWIENAGDHSRYDEEDEWGDLEVGGQKDSSLGVRHVLGSQRSLDALLYQDAVDKERRRFNAGEDGVEMQSVICYDENVPPHIVIN